MFYRGAMARVNQSELTKLGREIGHLLLFFIFAVRLSTKLSVSMGSGSLRKWQGSMPAEERAHEEDTSRCKDRLKSTHKYLWEQWTVWLSWISIYLTVPLNDIQWEEYNYERHCHEYKANKTQFKALTIPRNLICALFNLKIPYKNGYFSIFTRHRKTTKTL